MGGVSPEGLGEELVEEHVKLLLEEAGGLLQHRGAAVEDEDAARELGGGEAEVGVAHLVG